MKQINSEMTTPSRELTPEQIAPALAEAQGWILGIHSQISCWMDRKWFDIKYTEHEWNKILKDDSLFTELTLDPEIHAGMIDVLDEWLSTSSWFGGAVSGYIKTDYWHNQEYQQDIRLWQLRAVVEFLRHRREK